MKIELREISIAELTDGYADSGEGGVKGYSGKLDIRPPYQREFIYNEKERNAVITTIKNNFPLNVMYWVERDGEQEVPYEVMDGQQRALSICQYVDNRFSYDFKYFNNLTQDEKAQILQYKLMVYFCKGTDKEKLDWFKTINIAGKQLTEQELRNAVYAGSFVSDAKRYFSKQIGPAYMIAKDYLNGSPIRQEYLETALKWIAQASSTPKLESSVKDYMAIHQKDENALGLWNYFNSVINWVKATFTKVRKEMKGIEWAELYEQYKNQQFNCKKLEGRISKLMMDSEIQNKKGIYRYVLSGDEHDLSLRTFDEKIRREVYERQTNNAKQKGVSNCPYCADKKYGANNVTRIYNLDEMQADHILPWSKGGSTVIENCQMLCRSCNNKKSGN